MRVLRRLGRFERVAILLAGFVGVVALFFVVKHVSGEQEVELDLSDSAGRTSVELATRPDEISPGCGCLDPSAFAKHPWVGMSMPSTGFDLDVTNEAPGEIADGLWELTVMEPEVGETDWFASPVHSIWMRVVARRGGRSKILFSGRTTHLLLWTNNSVHVRQAGQDPYAALIPAGGGKTTFHSQEASRSQWGGSLDVSSTAPDRPEEVRFGSPKPSVAERGPMVDVLGPTDHFITRYSSRMRIWAALQEISGARPGDDIEISIRTPFSLRLFASPVQSRWQRQIPGAWSAQLLHSIGGRSVGGGELVGGPTAQGRVVLTEPLPSYSVRLANVEPPGARAWRSFARRSVRNFQLPPMLSDAPMDRNHLIIKEFALPPVPAHEAVSVFGDVTDFQSSSVRGRVAIGSTTHPVIRGSALHFHSGGGIGAGRYALTPLISTGQPTDTASLSGSASVWIGGSLMTHPWWSTWLPFGALIAALIGIAVAGIVGWVRDGSAQEH